MTYLEFISRNGHICSESEFEIARAQAKNKLAVIVNRFGDANGLRLKIRLYLKKLELKGIHQQCLICLVAKEYPTLREPCNVG